MPQKCQKAMAVRQRELSTESREREDRQRTYMSVSQGIREYDISRRGK